MPIPIQVKKHFPYLLDSLEKTRSPLPPNTLRPLTFDKYLGNPSSGI